MNLQKQICVGSLIACIISLIASAVCGALMMPGAENACGFMGEFFAIVFGATAEV